jgi:uncharacterized membrane-anchored protein YhcB (DUF1043 family)
MKFRFGSKSGEQVPLLDQSLQEIQGALAQQQQQWSERLANDPTTFAQLEPEIHNAFQHLADRCAAGLLVHAAAQAACADAAKKK